MRLTTKRLRAAAVCAVAGATAAIGLGALTTPSHADGTFTFNRLSGADSYATAGAIDQAAFPSGETTVLLADGLAAHVTDALAASGLEGVDGIGVLLTDDTDTVPSSTLTALSDNKVKDIEVVGGSASVTSDQVSELQSKGYDVITPFQGTDRYDTMEKIDETIKPSEVGKDANGNPTAILASGDPAHYVDALSAGALAYAEKFPIILTNSTSSTLQPEAAAVIQDLGIKDLIVVGGSASIPTSQYSSMPDGVTQVENEYGADRSATSEALAEYAIGQKWLSDAHFDLARGDEGTDALAGSAFGGVNKYPTVITDSPTSNGSTTDFAQKNASTLTGTSYIFGGTDAVPDSQASAVEVAAGAQSTAPTGPISPTSSQVVTAVSSTTFAQSGFSYAYTSGDTYQIDTTSSTPGSSASCTSSTYAAFQAALSEGDQVTGTYSTPGKSTFCLNDQAPHPPSTVNAAANNTLGGVQLTWTAPSTATTDGVTGYEVFRATATANAISSQFPDSCPSLPSATAGVSPQTSPDASSSGYTLLSDVPNSAGSGGSFTYNDTTATAGSSSTEYCYAVSAVSPSGSGANQVGTGTGDTSSSSSGLSSGPDPVAPGTVTTGSAPVISSVSGTGHSITITYNEAINPATVDSNGSDFTVTGVTPNSSTQPVKNASGFGDEVILDLPFVSIPSGGLFSVTQVSGGDGNSVCAANSTTLCAVSPSQAENATGGMPGANPTMDGASVPTPGTIDVAYQIPVDCATVDPGGGEYTATEGGVPIAVGAAACPSGSGPTSTEVVLTASSATVGTVVVTYDSTANTNVQGPDTSYGIVSSETGGAEPQNDSSS